MNSYSNGPKSFICFHAYICLVTNFPWEHFFKEMLGATLILQNILKKILSSTPTEIIHSALFALD